MSGGTISLGTTYCNGGVTCTPLVTGDGFAQYEVTDSGAVYVFTVITDAGAGKDAQGNPVSTSPSALPYYDESYIQRGNQSGIMGQQHSLDAASNFTGDTAIYTGWATTYAPQGVNLKISQGFSDPGSSYAGDGFSSGFTLSESINATSGNVEGKTISISQDAGLGDGTKDNKTDFQSFRIEYRSGTHTDTASNLILGVDRTDPNNSLAWLNGDEVMVTWIGQSLDTGGTGGGSLFGYEGLTRTGSTGTATAGTASVSTFSTANTDVVAVPTSTDPTGYQAPFDWDTQFAVGGNLNLPTLIGCDSQGANCPN